MGNVQRDSIPTIWNGPLAQEVRRSIFDGSVTHCRSCPFLASVTGCVCHGDALEDPDERAIVEAGTTLVGRIAWLNLAYDRTCNLSCSSCRTGVVVVAGTTYRRLEQLQRFVLAGDLLSQIDWLCVTGSGDSFAGRLYRGLLRAIDPARYPTAAHPAAHERAVQPLDCVSASTHDWAPRA